MAIPRALQDDSHPRSVTRFLRTEEPARGLSRMVFEDPRSQALLTRLGQVAPSNVTVLITGETGTGKELVARHVHELSERARRPFVAVNCGAFSEALIESDLFGHERGAFTGAAVARAGWFEVADGGTLFLDEIGELPLGAQCKLLRVLQEREVVRVGSRRAIPVDVRLIAATNVRLDEAVARGTFREDLYFRLAVAKLSIAPLRDRPGDILPLAHHFASAFSEQLGKPPGRFPLLSPEAERCLLAHPWPGNIRELENAIQHALLVRQESQIRPEDLALTRVAPRPEPRGPAPLELLESALADEPRPLAPREALKSALRALYEEGGPSLWSDIEELVMLTAYAHSRGNQLRTARLLGLSRHIVRARLLQYGAIQQPFLPTDELDFVARHPEIVPRSAEAIEHHNQGPVNS